MTFYRVAESPFRWHSALVGLPWGLREEIWSWFSTMRASVAFRVFMATLVAFWSPMWCQCMLLAATQSAPAQRVEPAVVHHPHDPESTPDNLPAFEQCCSDEVYMTELAAAMVALAPDCCPGQCEQRPAGMPCDCVCCDQKLAYSMPQVVTIDFSAFDQASQVLPAAIAIAHAAAQPTPYLAAGQWEFARRNKLPPASALTLLSQRCLLLI